MAKKKIDRGIPITIYIDEDLVVRIDKIADKAGLSRSKLIRNLLDVGIGEAETFDMVGLLSVVKAIEDLKQIVRERLHSGLEQMQEG